MRMCWTIYIVLVISVLSVQISAVLQSHIVLTVLFGLCVCVCPGSAVWTGVVATRVGHAILAMTCFGHMLTLPAD